MIIVGAVAMSCSTQVDAKRKAAFLDEIAAQGSLALQGVRPDQVPLTKKRIADVLKDAGDHYK